jgi:hypothetical protein
MCQTDIKTDVKEPPFRNVSPNTAMNLRKILETLTDYINIAKFRKKIIFINGTLLLH